MSRIVDNLLTLARVDEGRLELLTTQRRPGRGDRGGGAAAAAAGGRQGRCGWRCDGEHCEVEADPQRLHQALTNFIENAIKFSQPRRRGRVSALAAQRRGRRHRARQRPRHPRRRPRARLRPLLPRRPARAGATAAAAGSGLSICREVADAHGGRVWVESEEGKGSAFSLALPRVDAGAAPGPRPRHDALRRLRSPSRACS